MLYDTASRTNLQHSSIDCRAFRSKQRDGLRAGEEFKEGLSILGVTSPRGMATAISIKAPSSAEDDR